MTSKFLVYTPFTGLGLYNGFRGNRWLRNRITIFKQFVIPSLLNQTNRDFVHWISWRPEDKNNPHVKALESWLYSIPDYKFVFTYHGIAFWDDKYDDATARERLFWSLKETLPELMPATAGAEEIHMLLQPSDDLYDTMTINMIKGAFKDYPDVQACTFQRGYICNYNTLDVKDYDPKTNPPFFAIRFPRAVFFDPGKHISYTGPYKSHEYVGDALKLMKFENRGFMVGTHGENISTHFNHPYGHQMKWSPEAPGSIVHKFGIQDVGPLVLPRSLRKWIIRKLPHKWQKKFRYWWGERLYNCFYSFIRS